MKPEDRAQELELEEWERRQKQAILPAPTKASAKVCECGARIPAARRKAVPGVQICVGCQGMNEIKKKGRYASN